MARRRLREIATQALLPPHTNIVQLISREIHSISGFEYFVMEQCVMSLDEWMFNANEVRRHHVSGTVTENEMLVIMSARIATGIIHELCDALLTLERFGVTHGNIKPPNVFLSRCMSQSASKFPYKVKLSDFGVPSVNSGEGRPRPQYDEYVGQILSSEEQSQLTEYTVNDDFRAIVATVFLAWLGEIRWAQHIIRTELYSDDGFDRAVGRLQLDGTDQQLKGFLERSLPLPRVEVSDVLPFHDAVTELHNIGDQLGLHFSLETPYPNKDEEVIGLPGEDMMSSTTNDTMGSIENDERLSAMATFAMKAVTGRRQAKDFLSARNYLDWAKDLSQRLSKSRTELELGLYHFQWAMAVSLPAAQDAVRDFEQKPFEERIDGSSVKEILNLLDERIGLGCESYKKAYADEKNTLTPRPLPGANIKSLASLERIEYLKACG